MFAFLHSKSFLKGVYVERKESALKRAHLFFQRRSFFRRAKNNLKTKKKKKKKKKNNVSAKNVYQFPFTTDVHNFLDRRVLFAVI